MKRGDIALGKDDAFFIFGLKPDNFAVHVIPGVMDSDGRFKPDGIDVLQFNGVAHEGYAVGRGTPGRALAIVRVFLHGTGQLNAPSFVHCKDLKTIAFTAAKGKVIYLGDVEYVVNEGRIQFKHTATDISGARKYLEENYPNLAAHLEPAEVNLVETTAPCQRTVYIPILLPL